MKVYVCFKDSSVIIFDDDMADFIDASSPVEFIEHVPGCGWAMGTSPFKIIEETENVLTEYRACFIDGYKVGDYVHRDKIWQLGTLEESDDGNTFTINGVVYDAKDF